MDTTETVVTERSGYLWIILPDAVSMYNSNEIEQAILSKINVSANIVLDLSRTNTLFSAGLGLLIKIRKITFEKNGSICLVNISTKLHELLTSVKLDKVFPLFSTDVEFEIYQNDIWQKKVDERKRGFIFVAQIERNAYYLHISGQMISSNDLSQCDLFSPQAGLRIYLINLSGLEIIDMHGAISFRELTFRISGGGGQCRVFGANNTLMETLGLLGVDGYCTFYPDEHSAFNDQNPIIRP
jgi:anti-anti-sigma factor